MSKDALYLSAIAIATAGWVLTLFLGGQTGSWILASVGAPLLYLIYVGWRRKNEVPMEGMGERTSATIRALVVAIEMKDPYTKGHADRVSHYALEIGQALDLSSAQLQSLWLAGILHDIGKLAIPEQILTKPAKLSDKEWDIIQGHPSIGASIVDVIEDATIVDGVRYHHECYDGTGYPEGLAGEAIPLVARILSVADAYDAMTSTRSYRNALCDQFALDELRAKAGSQFDPYVVEAFCRTRDQSKSKDGGASKTSKR